jgi:hypothetical protein
MSSVPQWKRAGGSALVGDDAANAYRSSYIGDMLPRRRSAVLKPAAYASTHNETDSLLITAALGLVFTPPKGLAAVKGLQGCFGSFGATSVCTLEETRRDNMTEGAVLLTERSCIRSRQRHAETDIVHSVVQDQAGQLVSGTGTQKCERGKGCKVGARRMAHGKEQLGSELVYPMIHEVLCDVSAVVASGWDRILGRMAVIGGQSRELVCVGMRL